MIASVVRERATAGTKRDRATAGRVSASTSSTVAPECVIGEGGYAVVSRRGGVALKRIPWAQLDSALREIVFIKACAHRCIIGVQSVEVEPGGVSVVMKYYPATLTNYKVRGISDVAAIAYGLLSACSYIHSIGIIHCDIKCDNILVQPGPAPRPVLCDFGISLRVEERRHFGAVQTVTYRAPEVDFSREIAKYSPGIDVWSVGAVLFRVCTGRSMYAYLNSEDSSLYAARFFGTDGGTREERLTALRQIRSVEVLARVMSQMHVGTDSMLYRSGLAEIVALSLNPNPQRRSTASTLFAIAKQIVKKSFPEIEKFVRGFRPTARMQLALRPTARPLDEMKCVINVPLEVICACSQDCLSYAETLYCDFTIRTGVYKLEVALACIYIASATYCDSDALNAIMPVMDLSQVQKYAVAVLKEL